LLQILDDGRLTDNQGKTIDFKNTIIIMTSNLGSEYLLEDQEKGKKQVMDLVKQTFKPEFLNRIDDIILFNPLGFNVQVKIVDKLLKELSKRLTDKDINITFSDNLKKYVLNHGYSIEYGARPIKRFIQKEIETFIAFSIINEVVKPHQPYQLDVIDEKLTIL
jgi:ATP-dependent Clp protease ATP-binding subunit ClpB